MFEIIGAATVSEVKPGKVYRIRHNIGRDSQTGRHLKSLWKTVHCNKRQARDELARCKQELIDAEEARLHPAKRPTPTISEFAMSSFCTQYHQKPVRKHPEALQVRSRARLHAVRRIQDGRSYCIND